MTQKGNMGILTSLSDEYSYEKVLDFLDLHKWREPPFINGEKLGFIYCDRKENVQSYLVERVRWLNVDLTMNNLEKALEIMKPELLLLIGFKSEIRSEIFIKTKLLRIYPGVPQII